MTLTATATSDAPIPRWKRVGRVLLDARAIRDKDPRVKLFALWMITLIICSSVALALSTVPSYVGSPIWLPLELTTNLIFTLELAARCVLAPSPREFIHDVINWFDVLAVLPFWISLVSVDRTALLVLAPMRMLRILKLTRTFDGSIVIAKAIERSVAALCVPLFFLVVAAVICATFVFYLELAAQLPGEEAAFESVPHAMWFMIVTMTTVGFGDVTPSTTAGKMMTIAAMIFGVLFLAMPLAIVGNNFCIVWDDKARIIFINRLRQAVFKGGFSVEAVNEIFLKIDADGSGMIDKKEFTVLTEMLELELSRRGATDLWNAIDADQSGEISQAEFIELIFDGYVPTSSHLPTDDSCDKPSSDAAADAVEEPAAQQQSRQAWVGQVSGLGHGAVGIAIIEDTAKDGEVLKDRVLVAAGGAVGGAAMPPTDSVTPQMILELRAEMRAEMRQITEAIKALSENQAAIVAALRPP